MFRNQRGAATIIIAVIMLITITLIILFAASYNLFQERVTSNVNYNDQAFEAAEAGVEFGIVYLQQNSATILANPASGYIRAYSSSHTQNVSLTDGSKFTIAYTNPIQYNYNTIKVTSTGTSKDGTSSRVVSQYTSPTSLLSTPPTLPLGAQSTVSMSNSAIVNNLLGASTINSGSTVTLSNSAETLVFGIFLSSTSGNIRGDITQSNSTLSGLTNAGFFEYFFGASPGMVQSTVTNTYTNSISTNYSTTLNGMNGTTILINQTAGIASIEGSAVVGTIFNPVILIVNGNLNIAGSAQINGLVYATGGTTTTMSGSAYIDGALITSNPFTMSNSAYILYDPLVVFALEQQLSGNYYAKVPGTWRDF